MRPPYIIICALSLAGCAANAWKPPQISYERVMLSWTSRTRALTGTLIHAIVPDARIGEICLLRTPNGGRDLEGEVVGLDGPLAFLTPNVTSRQLKASQFIHRGRLC